MVEALGYRIERLFVGVFMAGSALAGLGGVLWALYRGQVHASMGANCDGAHASSSSSSAASARSAAAFTGAILVALIANYAGFLAPKLALVSNIAVMVACCLASARPLSGGRAMSEALSRRRAAGCAAADRRRRAAGAGAVPVPWRQGAQRRRENLRLCAAGRLLRSAARLYRHRLLRPCDVLRHRQSYGVALALILAMGPGWGALGLGVAGGAARRDRAGAGDRAVLAARADDLLRDGDAGDRLAFNVLASQLSDADGRRGRPVVSGPAADAAANGLFDGAWSASQHHRPTLSYYLVFAACVVLFLMLLRIVNSPFGRVLAGDPRESGPRRGAGLSHRVPPHARDLPVGGVRGAAGALNALWLHYTGPDTALSFSIMIDILVMVVIGGMGSLVRRRPRRGAVRHRGELSAGADGRLSTGRRGDCRCSRACFLIPTAGCSGSA
jgi:ABC-type branched-subunit amino acid transport system permease subunit